jgi:GrpB-like predicted nucleotidyltransferase (UPF0157 family)
MSIAETWVSRVEKPSEVHRNRLSGIYTSAYKAGPPFQNHLTLREYLRRYSDSAAKYGILKKQLAARFPSDMDAYIDGKTDFVLGVIKDMGLSDHQLAEIGAVNRLQ